MTTTEPGPVAATIRSARFRAVIGMTLLIMIGFGVIVPALPFFSKKFGAGEAGIGIVVFAFSLTRLFGDLFAASIIDRFGERKVSAIGAAIVGVSSVTAGASQSFAQLVVFRGIGGIGSAFFLGGLMAYLIGATPADQRGRAMSVFQASFGLGILIGPLLGGLLLQFYAPRIPFYLYGIVCLACVPLILRALTPLPAHDDPLVAPQPPTLEEHPPAPRVRAWSKMVPLLRNRTYRAALSVSALAFLIGQAQFTLVPSFWTDELGASKGTSGVPFAVAAAVGLMVVWHAGSLADRRGRKFALIPALVVLAIGTSLMGFSAAPWMFVGLMGVTGVATGYMRPGPSAMVADVSTPATRGLAVSGYRIAADAGALVGPLVAGFVAEYVSWTWAFISVGACAAVVLFIALAAEETAPGVRKAG